MDDMKGEENRRVKLVARRSPRPISIPIIAEAIQVKLRRPAFASASH
jgi:hypothetical protein